MTTTVSITHHEGEHTFTDQVVVNQPALNAVLFDFNPSSSRDVTTIKALHGALIQKMQDLQANPNSTPFQKRAAAIAITELEGTQMRAVKALFAKG